jgi:beta-lactamase class A
LIYCLALVPETTGCRQSAAPKAATFSTQPASQKSDQQASNDLELQKAIEQIALAAKGRVGVSARILETSETVSLNPRDHFPMQSVYKLHIAMAVMTRVDQGTIKLDQKVRVTKDDFVSPGQRSPIRDQHPQGVELTVRQLLEWLLLESDGTASDVLMRVAGGPSGVSDYLNGLKIKDTVVRNFEKEMGLDQQLQYQNWSSPAAAIELLRDLQDRRGLSEGSQALLLKLMTRSTTGPKRLKGLLPAGTIVAHRTGTSGTNNKGITAATNDIGLITLPNGAHLAIAVFVSDSPADEATREGVIAKIAKAVWDKWSHSNSN